MYNHNFYQLQGFSVFLFEEINFSFGKIQRIFLKKFIPVLEKYNFFWKKLVFLLEKDKIYIFLKKLVFLLEKYIYFFCF